MVTVYQLDFHLTGKCEWLLCAGILAHIKHKTALLKYKKVILLPCSSSSRFMAGLSLGICYMCNNFVCHIFHWQSNCRRRQWFCYRWSYKCDFAMATHYSCYTVASYTFKTGMVLESFICYCDHPECILLLPNREAGAEVWRVLLKRNCTHGVESHVVNLWLNERPH